MFGHDRPQSLRLSWLHPRVRSARRRELHRVFESAHALVPCRKRFVVIPTKLLHAHRKSHNLTVASYEPTCNMVNPVMHTCSEE
jgi:hypothetical protein